MHITVIGSGLLGTSTAWFLKKKGLDVTVIDRQSGAGLEASRGNGGYIQSGFPEPWNAPGIIKMMLPAWTATLGRVSLDAPMLVRTKALPGLTIWGLTFLKNSTEKTYLTNVINNRKLALYTKEALKEIRRDVNPDYDASFKGAMWLFRSEAPMAAYRQRLDQLAAQQIKTHFLNRDEVIEQEPSLEPIAEKLCGGIHFSEDENGNSHLFCRQLAEAAERAGVRFEYGQTVHKLSKTDYGVRIQTDEGSFESDAMVLAAGAYTPKLARQLGVNVPVKPAKGYSISVPMKDWQVRPSHTIVDMSLHAGVNALGDILRVAGTGEFAGYDTSISDNRIQSLFRLVEQIYPDFAANMARENIDPWCGFRPLSADGIPIIGDSGVEGVYLNTGHGGLGWSQSAGSGKALADQIAGESDSFNLAPYSINRFR